MLLCGTYAVISHKSWEHFLFSAICITCPHLPPLLLSCLACLYLIPFTGLSKIFLADLMGRRHWSNSLKTQNSQNKKHGFGCAIAVEQNSSVWGLTLRQHCGNVEWSGGMSYECEPISRFQKGLTTSTLIMALFKRINVCFFSFQRRWAIHTCYVFQFFWTWQWVAFPTLLILW